MSLSDKVRIHDFAKQYGMSGKDLAAKLRDCGFSKARSHMSALDPFDLVTAQGVLEANGIMPSSETASTAETSGGGLRVVKRLKRTHVDDEGPMTVPVDIDRAPTAPEREPVARAAEPAAASAPTVEKQPVPSAPAASPAEPAVKPLAPAAAQAGTASAAAPLVPGNAPVPEATAPLRSATQVPSATPPTTPPTTPVGTQPETQPVAPQVQALEHAKAGAGKAGDSDTLTPQAPPKAPESDRTKSSATADAPQPDAEKTPAAGPSSAAEAPSAPPAPAIDPLSPQIGEGVRITKIAASGEGGPVMQPPRKSTATTGKNDPPRRGNVIGFVDPSTFQTSPQRKKASSRRIASRDDAAPDVRPTYGGNRRAGGPASPQPAASGPRGNLTAAELREREQNRFLRHNRTSQTGHTQGRRAGGGRRQENSNESPYAGGEVSIADPITIAKLADTLALKAGLLIGKALTSGLGIFNINQTVDSVTATLIAAEFGVTLEIKEDISAEQAHMDEVRSKRSQIEEEQIVARSPTVAFLGHVDHGKTTLIDKIRSTRVAEGESGGITQHVGAYRVTTSKGHEVTIIDTPGHEAFTSMRARGAKAVDIVVLVVAGDDGVKPSTVEAINHAKAAKAPIVVAINKKDKPDFNAERVVQQLMGYELVPEQYSGNTAMFHTSGITGAGIDELLEHIFLMGDSELGLKAHPTGPASGVVLEAEIQQGRGIVAHLLIQDGTLSKGDVILAGEGYGKVRQILDDRGNVILAAGPSIPVAVTGLDALPGVGDPFYVVDALAKAKEIATERERTNRAKLLAEARDPRKQLEMLLGREAGTEAKVINLIVRTDVQGTAEVLKSEIAKLGHDEVELKVIHSGVGPITESDVDLATPSQAILIAFKVGVNGKARQMANHAGLDIKRYDVIYEVLDDLRALMQGALRPEYQEVITGHVEIRAIFKSSRIGLIAGCMVLDGTIRRNAMVRLMRDNNVVYTGSIGSLRREKDEAREVREGFECGIVLKDYRDIQQGDIIECYEMKEIKRTL